MKPGLAGKRGFAIISAICFLALGISANAQQSTSGPVRPSNVTIGIVKGKSELQKAPVVLIPGVPYYLWHHGCGPTALGMVIGYYDIIGYSDLIDGSSVSQTTGVNNAIANDLHYNDYSLPLDEEPNLLKDKSELGGAHASNCLGDFLQTSWSSRGNYYGWGYNSDMVPAFSSYFNLVYPGYTVTASRVYYSNPDIWNIYKNEIDNNRPVVMLVDSNGDGETDHFVTGTGYDDSENLYAIHDTWDNETHWYSWRGMASGSPWGIYCMNIFNIRQPVQMPNVSTLNVNTITQSSAVCGGNVEFDGGADVTARGVCWNTSPDPTVNLLTKTTDGSGTGSFISNMTGLTPGTIYYVRAYATNSMGTSYGLQNSFRTYNSDAVQDIEGNFYNFTTIGSQVWLTENLRSTRYNDNTIIPEVSDPTEWDALSSPGLSWYDNNISNKDTYGALYNNFTVASGNLCPSGWHVPSATEWDEMIMYLGGNDVAGGKLKEAGTSFWIDPNTGATNESGFTALPGGSRTPGGVFYSLGVYTNWWSSSYPACYYIMNYDSKITKSYYSAEHGLSVRCMKNTTPGVLTWGISSVTQTSAICESNVIYDGGTPVTTRGVCWSTSPGPSVDLPTKTSDYAGTGIIVSNLNGLVPGTTYYIRAYATNSTGTKYGEEVVFKTYNSDAIQDFDGNYYNIVAIGNQVWMAENLRYLPSVNPASDGSMTDLKYYVNGYNGTSTFEARTTENFNTYGVLYNLPAALNACPTGWHLPSDLEWTDLAEYLGGELVAGGLLKEAGTAHWLDPNTGATNSSGFTALPAGLRLIDGSFNLVMGHDCYFWSSTEVYSYTNLGRKLLSDNTAFERDDFNGDHGLSIRCIKDAKPIVATDETFNASIYSALGGGTVYSDEGYPVSARGVCWSTTPGPTTDLPTKTVDGSGPGAFSSSITGLNAGTTYYARAYATNYSGTGYGNEIIFKTYSPDAVQDIDGNYYNQITIGSQIWLGQNLRTTHLNNNIQIPEVTGEAEWISMTAPAMCYYDNNVAYKNIYGSLYNQYTVNTGSLCPVGWHVPTDIEWTALTDFLGGESIAGGKLKEAGLSHWGEPNVGATNESGFTALPGGTRYVNDGGTFFAINSDAVFWTSTSNFTRSIFNAGSSIFRGSFSNPFYGFSVRCIKDMPQVTTTNISELTTVSAQSGGNITYDGGSPIISRGVCWSTSTGPTVDLQTKTTDGEGSGSFASSITGLLSGTTYYLRSYATNSNGTSYGSEVIFKTYNADAIPDVEGNYYNIVTIGSQIWLGENLKTTRYNDNTEIPLVVDNTAWSNMTTPGYCWIENDPEAYSNLYGALYNWYAVNTGRLCPSGWHVPTQSEWVVLIDHLGGETVAGGKLKSTGTIEEGTGLWYNPNTGATNESNFTALPAGGRVTDVGFEGVFLSLGASSYLWSSTEAYATTALNLHIWNQSASVWWMNTDKKWGWPVRCIKDNAAQQSFGLTTGWNLLSFAVVPAEISMRTILDPLIIPDALVKVQDEKGKAVEHLSAGWINEIGDMSSTEGYKIRVTGETNLSITGQPVALPLDIPLEPGWNIIGYPSMNPQDASMAFGSLISSGTIVKVQNELGQAIEQIEGTWNYGFANLTQGEGYKVLTSTGATFAVTGGAKGEVLAEEREMKETEHFRPQYTGNGLDHMNIYIGMGEPPSPPPSQSYGGQGKLQWPKEGDEIGVFDGEICVGSAVVENKGKYIQVIASFDDPETMEKDGFTEGNTLALRLWTRESGEETELKDIEPVTGYRLAFERQGTTVLKTKLIGEQKSHLGDAYPNPSRDITTFTFSLAGERRVRLEIIDVVGITVAIVLDETMPGGEHLKEWDNTTATGNKAKAGVYFYRLTENGLSWIKQLIVQ